MLLLRCVLLSRLLLAHTWGFSVTACDRSGVRVPISRFVGQPLSVFLRIARCCGFCRFIGLRRLASMGTGGGQRGHIDGAIGTLSMKLVHCGQAPKERMGIEFAVPRPIKRLMHDDPPPAAVDSVTLYLTWNDNPISDGPIFFSVYSLLSIQRCWSHVGHR